MESRTIKFYVGWPFHKVRRKFDNFFRWRTDMLLLKNCLVFHMHSFLHLATKLLNTSLLLKSEIFKCAYNNSHSLQKLDDSKVMIFKLIPQVQLQLYEFLASSRDLKIVIFELWRCFYKWAIYCTFYTKLLYREAFYIRD